MTIKRNLGFNFEKNGKLLGFDLVVNSLEKDPDAGTDWEQEEKGTTEDEMVGWHHRLDGHEFE